MPVCEECGREFAAGSPDCRGLFDELVARDFSDVRFGRVHRLMVDVFCVAHPEHGCRSAKSLAAHLGGLCCAIEHGSHPTVHRALLRWLDDDPPTDRPALPRVRAAMTIADISGIEDGPEYGRAVERWADCVWEARAESHALARGWIERALAGRPAARGARTFDRRETR